MSLIFDAYVGFKASKALTKGSVSLTAVVFKGMFLMAGFVLGLALVALGAVFFAVAFAISPSFAKKAWSKLNRR